MLEPADFMKAQLAAAQAKFGKANCYVAKDHYIRQFGIPLPSLALQYMFGVENLPFGRFYGFSGPPQAMKSSICFWLLRNILEQGGLGILVETERKVSETLMHGIIGPYVNQLLQFNATSLEKAQEMILNAFSFYKKEASERHIPYGICWDSLRGVLSEQTSKKMDNEGHYTRQFSSEAHAISPFFAKMVEELSFWPMMLFFVQHEKQKQDDSPGAAHGAKQYSQLGGDAPKFHSTVLTRCVVTKKVLEGAAMPYSEVMFKTIKNNLGVLGKRIYATIYFEQRVTEQGNQIHNYWFDWPKADCDMLLSDKLANKSGVKEVLNLEEHSSNKGFYRCAELDVKKATAREIYDMLRAPENAVLMEDLQRQLRIQRNLRFDEVEWGIDGGTEKKPLYDWKVKAGVDISKIVSISEEEYARQSEESGAGKEETKVESNA